MIKSVDYCHITLVVTIVYLFILFCKRPYRLLLPSVLHSATWLITVFLLSLELKGIWVSYPIANGVVDLSTEYIFYLVVSSIVGFSLAHLFGNIRSERRRVQIINPNVINNVLNKFGWIPYMCFIIGVVIFVYLISTGLFNTFGEFREHAVTTKEWTGPMAIVQRMSGHVAILGSFYLMLLGYKHGIEGLNLKKFFKYALLCSVINLAIGGRLWLITSTLPYIIAFVYARDFSFRNKQSRRKDLKGLISLLGMLAVVFSLMGLARDDRDVNKSFIDKFLYFTDGAKMSNMVLNQYPPGSFELEYGKSEFLGQFTASPMGQKFYGSISDDVALAVTVQSAIPPLYYDFGYYGGILMWGIFCFIIELWAIRLLSTRKILGVLLFVQISLLFFLAPMFGVFSMYMPTFEWLLLLYLFRKGIFGSISGCQKYI